MTTTITLNRADTAIATVAAESSTRYSIGGVLIEQHNGDLQTTATDGRALLRINRPTENTADCQTVVDRADVLAAGRKCSRAARNPSSMQLNPKTESIRVFRDNEQQHEISANCYVGAWPKCQPIIDSAENQESVQTIRFDAFLLADLLTSMAKSTPSDDSPGAVDLVIPKDKKQPMVLRRTGGKSKALGIIMPMASDR